MTSLEPVHHDDDGQVKSDIVEGNDNEVVSALWEAALNDDELLEDDASDGSGLLPESDSESRPNSPSFLDLLQNGTDSQVSDDMSSNNIETQPSHGDPSAVHNEPAPQATKWQTSNPYAPHQPSSSDLAQMSPAAHHNVDNVGIPKSNIFQPTLGQTVFQSQPSRPSVAPRAESFVEQSKSGYKSPYDLPDDFTKPRKRIQMHQPVHAPRAPAPPPRSTSMTSDIPSRPAGGPLQSPSPPANANSEVQTPQASYNTSVPLPYDHRVTGNGQSNAASQQLTQASFFEDLPMTARPKPQITQGRYTPSQAKPQLPMTPDANSHRSHTQSSRQMGPPPVPAKKSPVDSYFQHQLQRPEPLDPYASGITPPVTTPLVTHAGRSPTMNTSQAAPTAASRYSPAPPISSTAPPPSAPSRYSPAPPQKSSITSSQSSHLSHSQPPQLGPHGAIPQSRYSTQITPAINGGLPFQPRTSSPLAYHGKKSDPVQAGGTDRISHSPPDLISSPEHAFSQTQSLRSSGPPAPDPSFLPPRRSQTQSPGSKGVTSSSILPPNGIIPRPASVHGPPSPVAPASNYQPFTYHLPVDAPTNETQSDPLERWRGCPIFRFGPGGSVVTSFPRQVPRYAAGSAAPSIKSMSGEVQVRNAKDIDLLPEHIAKFPGPLRSKSKKKEVLSWLSDRIQSLENELPVSTIGTISDSARSNEKILLWRVVRVIVEHDGLVEGNPEVQKAMNLILRPESSDPQSLPSTRGATGPDVGGAYKPGGSVTSVGPTDTNAIESLRQSLLVGEREKAVWDAVDHRLWAHALLLSSTLDRSVWKQVAHEFVRQEVKPTGTNNESLAALYEIFAGNLEESVDELVPPSARAGFQMVSKEAGAAPTKNALDGLDRWRETLGLVLNNRSPEDHKALAALGRLLANYGRNEASHICCLFASSPALPSPFGGLDDPQTAVVLLGADHLHQPYALSLDDDAILLTEVYEFATYVLASGSKSALMPHLQAYKLERVKGLAETGFKSEAHAYCEAMNSSLRATTKISPYYNQDFLTVLDELTQLLSQSPRDASSWRSKPTMGKVSDSMWNKFTTFVAGDEHDAVPAGSGREASREFGPFAKISGTSTDSRPGSSSDLHGQHQATAPSSFPAATVGSRYAPSGLHSGKSSQELTQGRPQLDLQRSLSYTASAPLQTTPYETSVSLNSHSQTHPSAPSHPTGHYAPSNLPSSVQSSLGTPPQTSYMPAYQSEGHLSPYQPRQSDSYAPTPPSEQTNHFLQTPYHTALGSVSGSNSPASSGGFPSHETKPPGSSSGSTTGYVPPSQPYSSYEPPTASYVPYQPPTLPDSDSETPRAGKTFSAEDVNQVSPSVAQSDYAPNVGETTSAAAEAKRRADDEGAGKVKPSVKQEKAVKPKSSWFGLFGRKESDAIATGEQKVYQAKLGEESSFYYDKDLKKWVDGKDPAGAQQDAKATPPPPKGPVGRVVSESLGTTMPPRSGSLPPPPLNLSSSRPASSNGLPSRTGTPGEPTSTPSGDSAATTSSLAASAPPPPQSAITTTTKPGARPPAGPPKNSSSDIDELLVDGGGPRKPGGTLKGRKGRGGAGRYVDIMAM